MKWIAALCLLAIAACVGFATCSSETDQPSSTTGTLERDDRGFAASAQGLEPGPETRTEIGGMSPEPAVPPREVSGKVRYESGRPALARVAVSPAQGGFESIEVQSTASGHYSAAVPSDWQPLVVVAYDKEGAKAELNVAEFGEGDLECPELVLTRVIKFRVRLACAPEVMAALPGGILGQIRVALVRNPPRDLAESALVEEVVVFDLGEGLEQDAERTIDAAGLNSVLWKFQRVGAGAASGGALLIQEIAAGSDRIDSELTLSLDMLMMADVFSDSEQPAAGVPLVVWVKSAPRQRIKAWSNSEGRCVMVVAPGAHGTLQALSEPTHFPWSAGQVARVVAPLSNRLCVRVVDGDGSPVKKYKLSLRNLETRTREGQLPKAKSRSDAVTGLSYTDWPHLMKGQAVFVTIPDVGEIPVLISKPWLPVDGPLLLRLPKPEHGALRFVIREPSPDRQAQWVNVRVRSIAGGAVPCEYLLSFKKGQASDGWTAWKIHPGRYDYVASDPSGTIAQGAVSVAAGATADVSIH